MKRLGAIVLAAVLIAGAILLNASIHDDDDAGGASGGPSGEIRVVCATEFAAVCRSLEEDGDATTTVEAPGDTADALVADPEPTFDLWITSEPWPEIAAIRAELGGTPPPGLGTGPRLAASPLGAVTTAGRQAAFEACGDVIDGRCLLTTTRSLGLRKRSETASLLAFGAMLTGWPDLDDPGTTDIDSNDAFLTAFLNAKSSSKVDRQPIPTILTRPLFDVAVDLDATGQFDAAADTSRHALLTLSPVLAIAVAVPADTDAGRAALEQLGADRLTDLVAAQGWSTDLPDDSGLPDPAVLDYLATRWSTR